MIIHIHATMKSNVIECTDLDSSDMMSTWGWSPDFKCMLIYGTFSGYEDLGILAPKSRQESIKSVFPPQAQNIHYLFIYL
jgi:hypothetical protein